MKVGDLAITHRGNHVTILEIGRNKRGKVDWYNIAFVNGNIPSGDESHCIRFTKATAKMIDRRKKYLLFIIACKNNVQIGFY